MDSRTNNREEKNTHTVSPSEEINGTGNETVKSAGEETKRIDPGTDPGTEAAKAESVRSESDEKRRGWFSRFIICCLAFFIVFGLINLLYYVLKMEPFGTKAVSIDDAKIQYIDFFTYYVDVLHGVRPLSYDFANMLGGSSIGLFSYYLASPFNLLLYYFGKKGVYRFFNLAVALKLGTAGATFSWFLQRRFRDRIRPVFVLALSMGYAMMQYSVSQSSNIMWLDGVYMLPLILLSVYEVIHRKSVWRLVLSVAFCIFFNWYIAGICCLFSGIWFLFEFFFYDREEDRKKTDSLSAAAADPANGIGAKAAADPANGIGAKGAAGPANGIGAAGAAGPANGIGAAEAASSVKNNNPAQKSPQAEKAVLSEPAGRSGSRSVRNSAGMAGRPRGMYQSAHTPGILVGITDFVVSFCRYVWGMGLGVCMSSFLFLPVISAMRRGKGQYDEIKILMEMTGDMLSCVRGYVIGTGSERGFAALFCGSIAVFAAAALLFSGSVRLRQKAAFIALAAVCLMMLHWEPAMLAFSLMKPAKSYWYRYSFLVCFAMLFGAGAYLSRAERDRWTKAAVPAASILYAAAVLKLNGIHFADFAARKLELVSMHKPVFVTVAASVVLSLLTLVLLSGENRSDRSQPDQKRSDRKRGLAGFAAGLLLLAVTGAELWGNAWLFWRNHSDGSQELYMEYSEGLEKQLTRLKTLDRGYYRIAQDRTRHHYEDDLTSYFNDSLAQNYWSNTAYSSSPDNTQLSLMWRLGYRDEEGCMMIVRDPVLGSDSFLGVKYLLQSTPVRGLKRVKNVEPFNGRSVYLNPYALPMAFVYDGSKLPKRRYENTFEYQNALFTVLSGRKTELYRPLEWTRENKENKSYFRVYIPEGDYVAYGNLLWPEKMDGLLSINGDVPFGYCRWTSPAAFMIKSRSEQEQSEKGNSLQSVAAAEKAAQAEREAAERALNGKAGTDFYSAAGEGGGTGADGGINAGAADTPESPEEKGPRAFLNRLAEKILISSVPEEDGAAAADEIAENAGETTAADAAEFAAGNIAENTAENNGVNGIENTEGDDPDNAAGFAAKDDGTENGQAAGQGQEQELSLTQQQILDLQTAASSFDREAAAAVPDSGYADIRTVVFRTEKGLTFKDYQFYALNLKELGEAAERIRSGEVSGLKMENGHITCSLEGRRGSSLCLLVPWTDGWEAWRNGEPVQPDNVAGTMITIPLENGGNQIELTYHIPYLKEGLYVSIAAFAVLLIDCLRRTLRRRKGRL